MRPIERIRAIKIGDEFGSWTVRSLPERVGKTYPCTCECKCSLTRAVDAKSLVRGRSTCCGGSCPEKVTKLSAVKPGEPFGKWTVVRKLERVNSHQYWLCRCECGNEGKVFDYNLVFGGSKSCGCVWWKHGEGIKTPEYISWQSMKARCNQENHHAKERYQGRGITYCKRWEDYRNFLEDMGRRPSPNHTLDRVENTGSYTCGHCEECSENGWPNNCKWSDWEEQENNRSNVIQLDYKGVKHTIISLAKLVGVPREKLYYRLTKGMPIEEAVNVE